MDKVNSLSRNEFADWAFILHLIDEFVQSSIRLITTGILINEEIKAMALVNERFPYP